MDARQRGVEEAAVAKIASPQAKRVHYESRRRGDDKVLTGRIMAIAAQKRRYGYRRIHVLLQREGWLTNHKRIWRLYSKAALSVRKRRRKRIACVERKLLPVPTGPNQSGSMDVVGDGLAYGRRFHCLTVVDDDTRECLAIEVDTSLPGLRVKQVFERLREMRGSPTSITVDNGSQFAGKVLDAWADEVGVMLSFVCPGRPVANAYIESFNARFRDECLNEHGFVSMHHTKRLIEQWRIEYNTERPHSSLGYLAPVQFAQAHEAKEFLASDSNCAPY
ncbi:IS3 family transposase [Mycetohabitans sp. B46]|uniref:IS3 family transposase n=1 Tax=Mycetohabitans sp. B46 TaxID=2772536 RepID=UPI00307EB4C8